MLYHISRTQGLKELRPHVSTHGRAYVYAVRNLTTGLLFGAPHDDFDFFIDEAAGVTVLMECYPGAFDGIFSGVSCSIYELPEASFQGGITGWDAEYVCPQAVPVAREIFVPSLRDRLLAEEAAGRLQIRRYEKNEAYKKIIAGHIVDRLMRFDQVYAREPRLLAHYGQIMAALQRAMDGSLLSDE